MKKEKCAPIPLDDQQRAAAKSLYGPNLIIAGPGSGKTRVLSAKVANMILDGIDPNSIILFTFTKKAANEMVERVTKVVGKAAQEITIGTYHSVCRYILKLYADKLDYKRHFSILDSDEQKKMISKICKDTGITPKAVIHYISEQKKNLITPQMALVGATGIYEKYAAFYARYQTSLKKQNIMDFDDLIFNTVHLLQDFPLIKKDLNEQYRYILADEAHDSSPLDLLLIDLLSGDSKNLTMIFDPDQSIYHFRGANIDSSMEYAKSLNPKTYYLDANYRSSSTIVDASKTLISHNDKLVDKHPYSNNEIGSGDKIIFYEGSNQKEEAIRIAQYIKLIHGKEYNVPYKEIAILYRTTSCVKIIEEALILAGIPYRVTNGCLFMNRMEVKDIMSFVKLAYNPYDLQAFERAIKIPKRGIGPSIIQKIYTYALDNDCDLIEAAVNLETKPKTRKTLDDFVDFIKRLKNQYLYMPPQECLQYIIDQTKYFEIILDDDSRTENIKMLLSMSAEYPNIVEMLEMSAFSSDMEDAEDEDKVNLMTLHVSKGLEFECVFICNFNEGSLPHLKATTSKAIEEERRLCFVGITRARKYLFLTRSKMILQNFRKQYTKPSRFLKEIDSKYLFKIGE